MVFLWSCSINKSLDKIEVNTLKEFDLKSKIIKGVIILENEPVIGATVYEVADPKNSVLSETDGIFEIKLRDRYPVIEISAMIEMDACYEVDPRTFNFISLDSPITTRSKKLCKQLKGEIEKNNL